MKKSFFLPILLALLALFNACNSNNTDDVWKVANTNAYDAITKNRDYQQLLTETGPSGVYYKVIQSGTGTEHPIQTSSVKVLYKGYFYDGTVFDSGSSQNGIPQEIGVNGVLYYGTALPRGLSFALQNMVVGDKWEIWIPYYLAYGTSGLIDSSSYQTIIKGYTTLVYEVELVSITQYPQ